MAIKLHSICKATDSHSNPANNRKGTVVNDPVVFLTKGGNKKPKMGTTQERKFRCSSSGHNAQNCRNKGKSTRSTCDGVMPLEQLLCYPNGFLPQSECGASQRRVETDAYNLNPLLPISQNQFRVSLGSCSDPWLNYLSIDNDSTD